MRTQPESNALRHRPSISIGIFAWNEERALPSMLKSLFAQSLFAKLAERGDSCEIFCVANGCTDQTASVAAKIFELHQREHPEAHAFSCRVADLAQRGKVNAWNTFVHSLAAPPSRFIILMDADIDIHREETLWRLVQTLEAAAEVAVAVDRPCKDIGFKVKKSARERLSLAASEMTVSSPAQLCGQLYCIRAEIARRIYLPKDLAACEDGFIKALVCTDFLSQEVMNHRIRLAAGAEHTFEAYTSPAAVLRNQKRQVLGQTIVHILVDGCLRELPGSERSRLAEVLSSWDRQDPLWLKRLIAAHLSRVRWPWKLHPGLFGQPFRRLSKLSFSQRLVCFPAATARAALELLGSFMAYSALKAGCTDYWPKAQRSLEASGVAYPAGSLHATAPVKH